MSAYGSNKTQVLFNTGEITPLLAGRVDVPKTLGACRRLRNMVLDEAGAAVRRPGWQFIAHVGGFGLAGPGEWYLLSQDLVVSAEEDATDSPEGWELFNEGSPS